MTTWARVGLFTLALVAAGSAAAQFRPSPERQALTEADYRATLQRLGIESMRPGADGFNRQAPNAANYEESRAGLSSPLPSLVDSKRRSHGWWHSVRRPHIESLLEMEMYGRVPPTAPRIVWQHEDEQRIVKHGMPAIAYRFRGTSPGTDLAIDLALTLPAGASAVPVVLELGFPEGFRFPGPPRPEPADPWTAQVLRRGWGYAILDPRSVQPDDGAGLREGVIGAAANGMPRGRHDWGALRAWAWGASRAYDHLSTVGRVDTRRIAVAGLSRYGKAALVTMAFDPRFSVGLIGSSGAGGAKLLRRDFGERLENLTSSGEYHWFAPAFLRYGGPLKVDDLPVDAHSLIALAAPRPLFIGAGTFDQDGWVDPVGSYLAAKAATPVYALHGERGLVGDPYPALNELRGSGAIAFRQHDGGHTNGPNWPAFLDFAARHWADR